MESLPSEIFEVIRKTVSQPWFRARVSAKIEFFNPPTIHLSHRHLHPSFSQSIVRQLAIVLKASNRPCHRGGPILAVNTMTQGTHETSPV